MSSAMVLSAQLVCSRALGWLSRARSGFALPEGATAAQIPARAVKSVAELGLAMSLVERERSPARKTLRPLGSWRTSPGVSLTRACCYTSAS